MSEWKNRPNRSGWWWVYESEENDIWPVYLVFTTGEIISNINHKWINEFPDGSLWMELIMPEKPTLNEQSDCRYERNKEPLSVPYDPRWD